MQSKSRIFILLLIFHTLIGHGQTGTLDTSFGLDGTIITSLGNGSNDNGKAVIVQPDSKIIVVGISHGGNIGMVRYNTDGSLDNSFGSGGIVNTPYGNTNIYGNAAVLQTDGKILVGGYIYGSYYSTFSVARYNIDGSLDNSFADAGICAIDMEVADYGYAIDVQSDGKIVIAGYAHIDMQGQDFALARLNTDGTIDNSFGVEGLVTTSIEYSSDVLNGIAMQSDGKIVAVGYTVVYPTNDRDFAVLRYNTDGELDTTFNNTGIIITDFDNGSLDNGEAVAIQPDGKILVAGYSESGSDADYAVARYNTDGSLDTAFNSTGLVKIDFDSYSDFGNSVVVQPNGKILLAGYTHSPYDFDYGIVRLNHDGTIDNSFGLNGITTTDFGVGEDKAKSMCLQPNGNIVVAGYAVYDGNYDFSVARYLNDLNVGVANFTDNSNSILIYPNPIKNKATFEYTLKKDEIVSLNLYSISGKLVKPIIVKEMKYAGKHKETIIFDKSVLTGKYILVLENHSSKISVNIYVK